MVEARKAMFLEEHEVNGSDATQKIQFEEVRDAPVIPLRVDHLVASQYNVPNNIEEQKNKHLQQEELHPEQPINVVEPANLGASKTVGVRRSSSTRRNVISSDYVVYLQESDYDIRLKQDHASYSQAMNREDFLFWYNAMKEEMESMVKNNVYKLVLLPKGVSIVGSKWIFKTKRHSYDNVERYKAILVSKGFTQKEGVDYHETFSAVSKKDSLRIIMALVAHFDLELHQIDVKTTFLNGDLNEEVYMSQPEGFVNPENDYIWTKTSFPPMEH